MNKRTQVIVIAIVSVIFILRPEITVPVMNSISKAHIKLANLTRGDSS